jgi:hypothetical protein
MFENFTAYLSGIPSYQWMTGLLPTDMLLSVPVSLQLAAAATSLDFALSMIPQRGKILFSDSYLTMRQIFRLSAVTSIGYWVFQIEGVGLNLSLITLSLWQLAKKTDDVLNVHCHTTINVNDLAKSLKPELIQVLSLELDKDVKEIANKEVAVCQEKRRHLLQGVNNDPVNKMTVDAQPYRHLAYLDLAVSHSAI